MFGNMININSALKTDMIEELKDILAEDFNTLVDSYIDDAQSRIVKLNDAIAQCNCEVVRTEAHSLKGSSLNLGAQLLPQLCSEMEDRGKSENLSGCESLFVKIETEFARVESELNLHITA
jgi:HPt (histidine-containing phosphotransfer) domain-containing protein